MNYNAQSHRGGEVRKKTSAILHLKNAKPQLMTAPEGRSKNSSAEKHIKVVYTAGDWGKINCQIIYALDPLMTVKSVASGHGLQRQQKINKLC